MRLFHKIFKSAYQTLLTPKRSLENVLGQQVFKNQPRNPFQSSTSSDHPCLLLYLLYYLYLRLMFSAVILKFYSVWWHFSLFKYEQISRHNPFTFFLQINDHTISLSKPILPSVQGPQYSKVFQQLAWKVNVHCVLHHSLKTNQRFLLASLILS